MRALITLLSVVGGLALLPAGTAQAATGGCDKSLDPKYTGGKWSITVDYYVIRSSLPSTDARRQDRLIQRVRDGAGTWNGGKNACHQAALHGFRTAYQGDSGSSATNFSDGRNTVDFAASGWQCAAAPGSIINACTHTRKSSINVEDYWHRNRFRTAEFDMRFNTANSYYSGVGTPCSGCTDTWALAAHEWGHVVGLKDLSGTANADQTMYGTLSDNSTRFRTLAWSDYSGLLGLYGP